MKIEPRKESDRGGWLCMPLLASVPEGKEGWEKVRCPVCGALCWKRPEDAGVISFTDFSCSERFCRDVAVQEDVPEKIKGR